MFTRTVDVLEAHTKEYWRISSIVTGRSKGRITTGEAIDNVNSLKHHLGPHRTLLRSVRNLSEVIVQGKLAKKAKPASITVLAVAASSATPILAPLATIAIGSI